MSSATKLSPAPNIDYCILCIAVRVTSRVKVMVRVGVGVRVMHRVGARVGVRARAGQGFTHELLQ